MYLIFPNKMGLFCFCFSLIYSLQLGSSTFVLQMIRYRGVKNHQENAMKSE